MSCRPPDYPTIEDKLREWEAGGSARAKIKPVSFK
jgi:hypothetical protein